MVQLLLSGGRRTVTIYLDGTWDATGAIALAAGLGALLFGCAYILLSDPAIRRIVALLMVLSSLVLLLASAIGFTRVVETIGPSPLLPGATGNVEFTATVAIGLGISFVSGVLAIGGVRPPGGPPRGGPRGWDTECPGAATV